MRSILSAWHFFWLAAHLGMMREKTHQASQHRMKAKRHALGWIDAANSGDEASARLTVADERLGLSRGETEGQ